MSAYVLEMKGITKTFPGVVALDDVTLSVEKGTVHALIGENGAGKSTLMKILNGVYTATKGELFLEGQPLHLQGVRDAQEKGISTIFQEFNLINALSVAENIFLGRFEGKGQIKWNRINRKARELLEKLGFNFDVSKPVGKLSTAEKQLVEIAKALSYDAKIIVMDEPTSSLTKKEIELFFPIIEKLRKGGITVIYISHKLDEIFHICDRVSIMRDGKLVGESLVSEITRERIIELMVGRSMEMEYPARTASPGEPVLEVKNLTREPLLHDISFTLHKGEILGIAGLVGAGRTELAETIFGAAVADSGSIEINGKAVSIRSTMDGKANSIGMVTEDRKETGLVLDMSVTRNITVTKLDEVTTGIVLSKQKEGEVASEYVQKLNIKTPSINQTLYNLSGGNQQKVVLSKWLFSNVEILILDEPTRGIDVGAKYEIYCLMNELTEQGKSIIMISSELPEVLSMSDRILVMHKGMIKGELTGAKMTADNVMQLAID
ncbi:MAG: sugar ABC transporter ATP-binding protein [Sphaerochaetaceae bacterium]|nr:sugar ABC transporter ATP-binding protein [Sphaerochaetaceae bacterium]MDD3942878.1 sugar ABC transporter ATP-binding protein [Sphaerochaetaceae bacterium]